MIRAVIFDCFGVLAEDGWLPFKRKYIGDDADKARAVADLGKQNEYGMVSNQDYIKQSAKIIGVDEAELQNAVGRQVPNQELLDYISIKLRPEYKIGLLSNANYDVLSHLFTAEQAKLFDASVTSYAVKLVKPDSRMFELITEQLGVAPEQCVFVDDVERYCTAAEVLGMHALVYKSFDQFKSELESILSSS